MIPMLFVRTELLAEIEPGSPEELLWAKRGAWYGLIALVGTALCTHLGPCGAVVAVLAMMSLSAGGLNISRRIAMRGTMGEARHYVKVGQITSAATLFSIISYLPLYMFITIVGRYLV